MGPVPWKVAHFAEVAGAAEEAESAGKPLPQSALQVLLEYPHPDASDSPAARPTYVPVKLAWQSIGAVQLPKSLASLGTSAPHEVSQSFSRSTFGQQRCFRFHRFALPGEVLRSSLVSFALEQEAAVAQTTGSSAQHASNVGGFHSARSVFLDTCIRQDKSGASLKMLRRFKSACVLQAAKVDRQMVEDAGEVPPAHPSDWQEWDFAGWVNVSRRAALNHLHDHGNAAYASSFYAQVPPGGAGALLVRLSPSADEAGMLKVDPDHHLPRMWLDPSGAHSVDGSNEVSFAELEPEEGLLLVFPGWLPHAVAPHFSAVPRVSFASNWAVPQARAKAESAKVAWRHSNASTPQGNSSSSMTVPDAKAMMGELIAAYESASFQSELEYALQTCEGVALLKARRELCDPVMFRILPKYGFEASHRGSQRSNSIIVGLCMQDEELMWMGYRAQQLIGLRPELQPALQGHHSCASPAEKEAEDTSTKAASLAVPQAATEWDPFADPADLVS